MFGGIRWTGNGVVSHSPSWFMKRNGFCNPRRVTCYANRLLTDGVENEEKTRKSSPSCAHNEILLDLDYPFSLSENPFSLALFFSFHLPQLQLIWFMFLLSSRCYLLPSCQLLLYLSVSLTRSISNVIHRRKKNYVRWKWMRWHAFQ